jgi:hypothetical protein
MNVGGLLLLPIRGLLLWLVVPLSLVAWPLAAATSKITKGSWLSPRQCVRFGDDLLTAALGNTLLRPFLGPSPWPWQPGGQGIGGSVLLGLW